MTEAVAQAIAVVALEFCEACGCMIQMCAQVVAVAVAQAMAVTGAVGWCVACGRVSAMQIHVAWPGLVLLGMASCDAWERYIQQNPPVTVVVAHARAEATTAGPVGAGGGLGIVGGGSG